jgi:hypothetical protein
MIMKDKLHKLWKDVVVAHFRYYCTMFLRRTESSNTRYIQNQSPPPDAH